MSCRGLPGGPTTDNWTHGLNFSPLSLGLPETTPGVIGVTNPSVFLFLLFTTTDLFHEKLLFFPCHFSFSIMVSIVRKEASAKEEVGGEGAKGRRKSGWARGLWAQRDAHGFGSHYRYN